MKIVIFAVIIFLFTANTCYADFVAKSSLECIEPDIIAYHQCANEKCGTGYMPPEGCSDPCKAKLKEEQDAFEECAKLGWVCLKHACQVAITSDYEGVSADGVSNITFSLEVLGDYQESGITINPKQGEALSGEIKHVSGKKASFTPKAADKDKDYRTPQVAQAVGWCIPKQASCETGQPEKQYATKDFSIEQPPIFFVHGIWSSAGTWSKDEVRAKEDGWEYEDITYPTQNNTKNAGQLSYEIKDFIKKIKSGAYYNKKRISAAKVDVVAHSMGGIVTRYYIGSGMYTNNIRKFIIIGTPNHGLWFTTILKKPTKGDQRDALVQLMLGSNFLNELNKQKLRTDIEYHTIAGTGWQTFVGFEKLSTWRGDGVVSVDSVALPGVPIYCTWDTHAEKVYGAVAGYPKSKGLVDPATDISLTASQGTYDLIASLLLTGSAPEIVNCKKEFIDYRNEELKEKLQRQRIARLHSPATLHAYDEYGNHIGYDKNGEIENTIGGDALYTPEVGETDGQAITIVGDKKIKFVIKGYEQGEIGFDFTDVDANGNITEKRFDNINIDARTQYMFDTSSEALELVKEEITETKVGYRWYMSLTALLAILFGVITILKSRKNKMPKSSSKK